MNEGKLGAGSAGPSPSVTVYIFDRARWADDSQEMKDYAATIRTLDQEYLTWSDDRFAGDGPKLSRSFPRAAYYNISINRQPTKATWHDLTDRRRLGGRVC